MIEITLKIDDKDDVSICQNGELVPLNIQKKYNNTDIYPVLPIQKKKERTYDTFMLNDTQFFRLGEIYRTVAPDDTETKISRTKYYKDRKKVTSHAVQ